MFAYCQSFAGVTGIAAVGNLALTFVAAAPVTGHTAAVNCHIVVATRTVVVAHNSADIRTIAGFAAGAFTTAVGSTGVADSTTG